MYLHEKIASMERYITKYLPKTKEELFGLLCNFNYDRLAWDLQNSTQFFAIKDTYIKLIINKELINELEDEETTFEKQLTTALEEITGIQWHVEAWPELIIH